MNDLKIRFEENEIKDPKYNHFIKIPTLGVISPHNPISSSLQLNLDKREYIEIARNLLPKNERLPNLFALNVIGNSMTDAMIHDKDIIVLKPDSEAKDGEMVAVWLSRRKETVLRYLYKEKDGYRLQPANPLIKPTLIGKGEPFEIKGKVVMVIRKVKI